MSNTDPISTIKDFVSVVNKKKKELDDLTKELYKMTAELNQYKGKKVTVCYLTGMSVYGHEVTNTISGVLTAVSATGQSFTIKADIPGGPTSAHIKILNLIDMRVDE